MRKTNKHKQAFTLIELMVVIASLSVLLMVAIPAFGGYVKRSKTSEAMSNINMMFRGAVAYYEQEAAGAQGIASGQAGHCIVGTTALFPTTPTSGKQQANFHTVAEFKSLGFSIVDPVYYGYRILTTGGVSVCGQAASSDVYTFMAMGDIDADNVFSRFELAAGTDASNALYHSRGFYIVNEPE